MSRRAQPPLKEVFVADPGRLKDCIQELADYEILGFDTEFVGEDTYRPDLCLIQVSSPESLYVIDPLAVESLDGFWRLLHDPKRVVIAHAAREEVRMCRFASGVVPANLFDTQIAAGFIGMTHPISYAALVQEILGVKLHKSDTLSDWRRRPLTPSQISYAYDDVRFLIPIYETIHKQLRKLKREDWAKQEFAAFTRKALGEEVTQERWRKVKGMGALRRRELAVARAIFQWRDAVAEKWNRPPRTVLRDDLLIEIARQGAKSPDDATQLRGLPKNELENIAIAIRKANALPTSACPKVISPENDPPQVTTIGALLSVVLANICSREELAQSLVASGQELKDLVRATQRDGFELTEHHPFASGWRRDHILPELAGVLAGKTGLRIKSTTAMDPIELVELADE